MYSLLAGLYWTCATLSTIEVCVIRVFALKMPATQGDADIDIRSPAFAVEVYLGGQVSGPVRLLLMGGVTFSIRCMVSGYT